MTTYLFDAAYHCLMTPDLQEKVSLSHQTAYNWRKGDLTLEATTPPQLVPIPGQPHRLRFVASHTVPHRRLGTATGQIALLHALAHIEFNAINLAWDAVYRFRGLPRNFYDDWVQVAAEETTHFLLLHEQLQQRGHLYGDLPVHNRLWEMANKTAHDVLLRMALIPRVLEARGLDATPPLIAKLRTQKLDELAEILQLILQDEIGHVAIGSYWFSYLCMERGWDSETTFLNLVKQYLPYFRGTFNLSARLTAGFSLRELQVLEQLQSTQKNNPLSIT